MFFHREHLRKKRVKNQMLLVRNKQERLLVMIGNNNTQIHTHTQVKSMAKRSLLSRKLNKIQLIVRKVYKYSSISYQLLSELHKTNSLTYNEHSLRQIKCRKQLLLHVYFET